MAKAGTGKNLTDPRRQSTSCLRRSDLLKGSGFTVRSDLHVATTPGSNVSLVSGIMGRLPTVSRLPVVSTGDQTNLNSGISRPGVPSQNPTQRQSKATPATSRASGRPPRLPSEHDVQHGSLCPPVMGFISHSLGSDT